MHKSHTIKKLNRQLNVEISSRKPVKPKLPFSTGWKVNPKVPADPLHTALRHATATSNRKPSLPSMPWDNANE